MLETLDFYLKLKGCPSAEGSDRAYASATSVELGFATERLVGRLSGGMKRRVSLAISLLADPSVLNHERTRTRSLNPCDIGRGRSSVGHNERGGSGKEGMACAMAAPALICGVSACLAGHLPRRTDNGPRSRDTPCDVGAHRHR